MSKLICTSLLLGLVMALPARAADQPSDPQKDKDVHTLLELSGAAKMGEQMFNAVVGQMRKLHPEIPAEFWAGVAKEVDFDGLVAQIAVVYANHFSDEEVQEMIKFYQSPVGQKLVREQPAMMQESMQIGQKWGYDLSVKVTKQMKEKGYLKS